MDFYTLCKFYVQNYTKVKNNQKLTQYLIYSCKLLEIKRNKLKLGAIVFEIQPTVINNVLVNYSFEMVFARQPSANKSKKTMNEILTFFQWHWDFKNVVTLVISLVITLTYICSNLRIFYKTYITGALLDEEHLNIILNQIFTLLETKPINVTFFTHISNILAELSLYLNLF